MSKYKLLEGFPIQNTHSGKTVSLNRLDEIIIVTKFEETYIGFFQDADEDVIIETNSGKILAISVEQIRYIGVVI